MAARGILAAGPFDRFTAGAGLNKGDATERSNVRCISLDTSIRFPARVMRVALKRALFKKSDLSSFDKRSPISRKMLHCNKEYAFSRLFCGLDAPNLARCVSFEAVWQTVGGFTGFESDYCRHIAYERRMAGKCGYGGFRTEQVVIGAC